MGFSRSFCLLWRGGGIRKVKGLGEFRDGYGLCVVFVIYE